MLLMAILGMSKRLSRLQWRAENYFCSGRALGCTMDAANFRDAPERTILFLRTVYDQKGKTGNEDEYNVTHKRLERNFLWKYKDM